MTPSDNADTETDAQAASDSSGASGSSANGGQASPPWQRVDRDGFGSGRESDDRMTHTGDLPVVSGVAAQGMFGNPPAGSTTTQPIAHTQQGQMRAQDDLGMASLGTRGRSAPSALRTAGRGPRRASLMVKRIDPWSVLKLSLVLGVAMFLVWMVAVGLLYIVLDGMGVWDKLNGTYTSLVSGEGADSPSEPLISAGRVFGVAAIVGMVNIVLLSALATVSAFIYNVSADLAGGLEITLSERE